MFDLTDKTALVTGATGGIGEAIAKTLHAQGVTVALSGLVERIDKGRTTGNFGETKERHAAWALIET